jgi:Ca2+:H+ antiporter
MITLIVIVVFILILPNYTTSHSEGEYTSLQLIFSPLSVYYCISVLQWFRPLDTALFSLRLFLKNSDDDNEENEMSLEKPTER